MGKHRKKHPPKGQGAKRGRKAAQPAHAGAELEFDQEALDGHEAERRERPAAPQPFEVEPGRWSTASTAKMARLEDRFEAWGMPMQRVTLGQKLTRPGIDPETGKKKDMPYVRKEFNAGIRAEFLRFVGETYPDELASLGFSETQIDNMVEHGWVPEGYNVHHKLPISFGGDNRWSNLILIEVEPYHTDIHRHADRQVDGGGKKKGRTILMAMPEGPILMPGKPGYWADRVLADGPQDIEKVQEAEAKRGKAIRHASGPLTPREPPASEGWTRSAVPATQPSTDDEAEFGWGLADARLPKATPPAATRRGAAAPAAAPVAAAADDGDDYGWGLDGASRSSPARGPVHRAVPGPDAASPPALQRWTEVAAGAAAAGGDDAEADPFAWSLNAAAPVRRSAAPAPRSRRGR